MRKIFTFLLMSIAVLGVTACGKKGDVNPPPSHSGVSNDQS